jgi:hypothetical protein
VKLPRQPDPDPDPFSILSGKAARLKYLVASLLPSSTGVVPTACLMIQLAWTTLGMSLKRLSRSAWQSGPSHRNLQGNTNSWENAQERTGTYREYASSRLVLCAH